MSLHTIAVIILCDPNSNRDKTAVAAAADDNEEDATCCRTRNYIVAELESLAYDVRKVVTLPAAAAASEISNEIESLTKQCDALVIVAGGGGGVGTVYQAIARAFLQDLQHSPRLATILRELPIPINHQASIPRAARLLTAPGGDTYPVVHLQRVFVLLNGPHFADSVTQVLRPHLVRLRSAPSFTKVVRIERNGNSTILRKIACKNQLGGSLRVDLDDDGGRYVTVTATASSQAELVEFERRIRDQFKGCSVWARDATGIWDAVAAVDGDDLIRGALEKIEHCLDQFGGPSNVFVSFNGGKDCTVLLHLILMVFKRKYPDFDGNILCLYVQSKNPFVEQEQFIEQCRYYYGLEIITIQCGIKDGLRQILDTHPNYKACLMGTRRTDPYSTNLTVFQMTDPDWPQIMRVCPLLDWHYSDIWDYLLYYKVPYCKLYDMGYTSLGNVTNTVKNPSLLYYDVLEGRETYLPAYKLLNETQERHGRTTTSI